MRLSRSKNSMGFPNFKRVFKHGYGSVDTVLEVLFYVNIIERFYIDFGFYFFAYKTSSFHPYYFATFVP